MAATDDGSGKTKDGSHTPLVAMDLSVPAGSSTPIASAAVSNEAFRQRTEEDKKKEAARKAEEATRRAEFARQAEEARQARLDADWQAADAHRHEYQRMELERKAKAREDAQRLLRSAALVVIAAFALWQLSKSIRLPVAESHTPVASHPQSPVPAKTPVAVINPRGASDLDEGGKFFNSQDFVKAAESFRKAAEQGNPKAQSRLGTMYADGKGVAQDYVEADMWFSIAAATGGEDVKSLRETVEKAMTPEKIAEAAQRAAEWVKAHQQ